MKKILSAVLVLLISCLSLFANSAKWDDASSAYRSQNWKEAIQKFKEIDEHDEAYATAQRYIGYNIYGRELNNWSKAVEHCINAYKKDPNDPKVLEDLGRACLKRQIELESD